MGTVKMAFFDLSGTILHHGDREVIPGMPELLKRLENDGWDIHIVTNRDPEAAAYLLWNAGLDLPYEIHESYTSSKGAVIRDLITRNQCGNSLFVDDWQHQLDDVRRHCKGAVRLVGFLGSGKYTENLSRWCNQYKVELAESPAHLEELLTA